MRLPQRFHDKVAPPDENGCTPWTASTTKGYGQFKYHLKWCYAHRLAYEEAYGKIPKGMLVMHSCDNPKCVNPAHLSVGTHADNQRDMSEKGRGPGHRKYPQDNEIIIQAMYDTGDYTQKELAQQFGMSQQNISHILK